MSTTYPSSRLLFLSSLPSCKKFDKVRFLGCVQSYSPDGGSLTLTHDYPVSEERVIAKAHVSQVLEDASRETFCTGAWVNVTGYVKGGTRISMKSTTSTTGKASSDSKTESIVEIDAILLWPAADLNLSEYEHNLQALVDRDIT